MLEKSKKCVRVISTMTDFLGKLSTYNLFNYLFTGVLFVAITNRFTSFLFIEDNLVLAPFVYYFIGLVLSRIGSLVIEPFLKMVKFVHFADYTHFMTASKNDPQIEVLSEANNMYRTICALFVVVILLKIYAILELSYPILHDISALTLIGVLLVMFLFAYRKQTNYITKRIAKNL